MMTDRNASVLCVDTVADDIVADSESGSMPNMIRKVNRKPSTNARPHDRDPTPYACGVLHYVHYVADHSGANLYPGRVHCNVDTARAPTIARPKLT